MNESILQLTTQANLNPLIQYVTMESCKDYARHAITMQYVFGAMALLAIALTFYLLNKKGKLKPTKEEIKAIKEKVKD